MVSQVCLGRIQCIAVWGITRVGEECNNIYRVLRHQEVVLGKRGHFGPIGQVGGRQISGLRKPLREQWMGRKEVLRSKTFQAWIWNPCDRGNFSTLEYSSTLQRRANVTFPMK